MEEEVKMQLELADNSMNNAIEHLKKQLVKIRAGKANVHILDGIMVDYYGTNTPLNQVSNINTPDPKMITIQPWEKSLIEVIDKAIMKANIGITPVNDGEMIRLNIPPLTEERRINLVKQVKKEGEDARVGIRSARRHSNDELKKLKDNGLSEDLEKDAEGEVQKLTDKYIKLIGDILDKKEKDIMTV